MANNALKRLMEKAENNNMWITTMKNLSVWWKTKKSNTRWPEMKKGAFCITGDVDCVTLFDYLRK
jgi:hypothetical protein